MKMLYKLANPDALVATMTISMSVSEWKQLDKELSHAWPASKLSEAIGKILREAERTVYNEQERDGCS